jgi:hypothetical protein
MEKVMLIKTGDMVRESKYHNIGRVIDTPSDAQKYYVVSFDYSKSHYTQEQIDSGSLRVLSRVTP